MPLKYTKELQASYDGMTLCNSFFKNKKALVTGGYGGIGVAIVKRLSQECGCVVVAGRDKDKLDKTIKSLSCDGYNNLTSLVLDNSKPSDFTKAILLEFKSKPIDIFINCAGVFTESDRFREFRNVSKNTYNGTVDVNLKSTLLMCTMVAEEMGKYHIRGNILNIASICGIFDSYGYTPYGLSKAGVIDLTKQLGEKYKDTIVVSGIAPGPVVSAMGHLGLDSIISNKTNILNRTIIPEEIAALCAFMCTPLGKYFAGQTIVASAGTKF